MLTVYIAKIENNLTITKAGQRQVKNMRNPSGYTYLRNSEIDIDSIRHLCDTMPHPVHALQSGQVVGWVRMVSLDLTGVTICYDEDSIDNV